MSLAAQTNSGRSLLDRFLGIFDLVQGRYMSFSAARCCTESGTYLVESTLRALSSANIHSTGVEICRGVYQKERT